jgi:hypothetical protein
MSAEIEAFSVEQSDNTADYTFPDKSEISGFSIAIEQDARDIVFPETALIEAFSVEPVAVDYAIIIRKI